MIDDEIQEQFQSARFLECLRTLTKKYPKETKEFNILEFIDDK